MKLSYAEIATGKHTLLRRNGLRNSDNTHSETWRTNSEVSPENKDNSYGASSAENEVQFSSYMISFLME